MDGGGAIAIAAKAIGAFMQPCPSLAHGISRASRQARRDRLFSNCGEGGVKNKKETLSPINNGGGGVEKTKKTETIAFKECRGGTVKRTKSIRYRLSRIVGGGAG